MHCNEMQRCPSIGIVPLERGCTRTRLTGRQSEIVFQPRQLCHGACRLRFCRDTRPQRIEGRHGENRAERSCRHVAVAIDFAVKEQLTHQLFPPLRCLRPLVRFRRFTQFLRKEGQVVLHAIENRVQINVGAVGLMPHAARRKVPAAFCICHHVLGNLCIHLAGKVHAGQPFGDIQPHCNAVRRQIIEAVAIQAAGQLPLLHPEIMLFLQDAVRRAQPDRVLINAVQLPHQLAQKRRLGAPHQHLGIAVRHIAIAVDEIEHIIHRGFHQRFLPVAQHPLCREIAVPVEQIVESARDARHKVRVRETDVAIMTFPTKPRRVLPVFSNKGHGVHRLSPLPVENVTPSQHQGSCRW